MSLAWRLSIRWEVGYGTSHIGINFAAGCVVIDYHSLLVRPDRHRGWNVKRSATPSIKYLPCFWEPQSYYRGGVWWLTFLPLWMLLAVVAIPTFLLWWFDRRPYSSRPVDFDTKLIRMLKWVGLVVCIILLISESITGRIYRYPVMETLFATVAVTTALLWRHDDHRISPGHCNNCNYNLTGNVSGTCPECGTSSSEEVKT